MDTRHSKSFLGWKPTRKCSPAPVGGQVDTLLRIKSREEGDPETAKTVLTGIFLAGFDGDFVLIGGVVTS